MVVVCNFDTVPTNAPIPICDVEFCCQGPGVSEIDIFTVYAFTVVVGDSTVYDPIIDSGRINLTQTVPAYGEAIPTLSEWGMIIFMTIILGSGVVFILRRKMA